MFRIKAQQRKMKGNEQLLPFLLVASTFGRGDALGMCRSVLSGLKGQAHKIRLA